MALELEPHYALADRIVNLSVSALDWAWVNGIDIFVDTMMGGSYVKITMVKGDKITTKSYSRDAIKYGSECDILGDLREMAKQFT